MIKSAIWTGQFPPLVAPFLVILLFLTGCTEMVRLDAEPLAEEIQALFDQKYIDPLTRYMEEHAKDPSHMENLARARKERDRRCGEIAERYRAKSATTANLDRLERNYRYSCPQVVDEFAVQVAEGGKPEPVAEVRHQVDTKATENCYLLFAIKNYQEAPAACEPPAKQGDARSQHNLGIVFSVIGRHPEGLKWTKLAVAQGLPEAQLHLGLLHQKGQGVSHDERKALQWFQRAGEQGVAEAQYRAGLSYYRGEGAERDYGKALQWLGRAAEQGYAAAQSHLGEMYTRGKGTEVDGERAESWLTRAAEQGATDAQYRLGVLYTEGKIIPKDETAAYVWLSVAALAGNRQAEELRDQLARTLAPVRIKEVQHRIRRIVERER